MWVFFFQSTIFLCSSGFSTNLYTKYGLFLEYEKFYFKALFWVTQPFWVYTQKSWKQRHKEVFAPPWSQQHEAPQPEGGPPECRRTDEWIDATRCLRTTQHQSPCKGRKLWQLLQHGRTLRPWHSVPQASHREDRSCLIPLRRSLEQSDPWIQKENAGCQGPGKEETGMCVMGVKFRFSKKRATGAEQWECT